MNFVECLVLRVHNNWKVGTKLQSDKRNSYHRENSSNIIIYGWNHQTIVNLEIDQLLINARNSTETKNAVSTWRNQNCFQETELHRSLLREEVSVDVEQVSPEELCEYLIINLFIKLKLIN